MKNSTEELGVLVPHAAIGRRVRFRWRAHDRVVEVSLIFTWTHVWHARDESRSPLWSSRSLGPLTIAVRFPVELGVDDGAGDDVASVDPSESPL